MANKPLTEHTEDELRDALANHVQRNVIFSYNDVRAELERKTQQRNVDRVYKLSIVAIIVSVISLAISALVALFK